MTEPLSTINVGNILQGSILTVYVTHVGSRSRKLITRQGVNGTGIACIRHHLAKDDIVSIKVAHPGFLPYISTINVDPAYNAQFFVNQAPDLWEIRAAFNDAQTNSVEKLMLIGVSLGLIVFIIYKFV